MFETCKTLVVLDRCSAVGPVDLPRLSDMGWKQDGSGREGGFLQLVKLEK